jgi:hypothetical protein
VAAPDCQNLTIGCDLLDSVVGRVGDIQIVVNVHSHAIRPSGGFFEMLTMMSVMLPNPTAELQNGRWSSW